MARVAQRSRGGEGEAAGFLQPQVLGAAGGQGQWRGGRRPAAAGGTGGAGDDGLQVPFWAQVAPETRWSLAICSAAGLDLLISAVVGCVALVYACRDSGIGLFGIAFQALSHWLCSFLLVFRLLADLLPEPEEDERAAASAVPQELLLQEQNRRNFLREKAFSTISGLLLLVAGIALPILAIGKLKMWDSWHPNHTEADKELALVTVQLGLWGSGFYTLQAVGRLLATRVLSSARSSVAHASVVSTLSVIFLTVVGVAASIEERWSWRAEPLVAMALALGLLAEALHLFKWSRYGQDAWPRDRPENWHPVCDP